MKQSRISYSFRGMNLLGTRLYTWLKGHEVGRDYIGNIYYQEKSAPQSRKPKRWVMYQGEAEASKVPPEWHGWLHYITDELPGPVSNSAAKPWIKPHQENLTGTPNAYRPPGHVLKGAKRAKATGDYEAWVPDNR